MLRTATLVLALWAGPLQAANVPIMGADKPVPKDSFAELSVLAEKGDKVSWEVFPVPTKLVDKGDGMCYFLGPRNRKYEVRVFVVNFDSKKFDRGSTTVTFERTSPDDPDEEPDPDVEPDPGAVTFLNKVRAAYRDETDADKKSLLMVFEEMCRRTANSVDLAKTREDVFLAMTKHGADLKLTGRMKVLQVAVGAELRKRLPWDAGPDHDQAITDADRKKAKDAFTYVADTLAKVKP